MNGIHKQINRITIFALVIGGVVALNTGCATAAPGPRSIPKPAPAPAPAPKIFSIPPLIAKPTPPPTSPQPLVTVPQLPSFAPWTAAPSQVKTPPPVEEKRDNEGIKITLSGINTVATVGLAIATGAAAIVEKIPINTPLSMSIGALIAVTSKVPGNIGEIANLASIIVGSVSLYGAARG